MRESLRAHLFLMMGIIIALGDFLLKSYVLKNESTLLNLETSSLLNLTLHKNYGALANFPIPLPLIITISSGALIIFSYLSYKNWKRNPFLATSYSLIILGALGNLYDRIVHGFTLDYLLLFKTSIINLSDVLIFLGILGILYYTKGNPDTQPA